MKKAQEQKVKDGLAMTLLLTLTTLVTKQAIQKGSSALFPGNPVSKEEQIKVDTKDAIAWAVIAGVASGFLAVALQKYRVSVKGDIV